MLFRSPRFTVTPPTSLMAICGLTPGDFAAVHHRARLLGESRAEVLVEWLGKEVALRGHKSGPVGFQMPEPTVRKRDLC